MSRLGGHKAIVAHLATRYGLIYNVDTVRKWVSSLGMPIEHERRRVFITASAFDAWFASTVRKSGRPTKMMLRSAQKPRTRKTVRR